MKKDKTTKPIVQKENLEEYLRKAYAEEYKKIKDIMRETGKSKQGIYYLLEKYKIPKRNRKRQKDPLNDKIIHLYIIKDKKIREIAELLGCKRSKVVSVLKINKVKIKQRWDKYNQPEYRKNLLDELILKSRIPPALLTISAFKKNKQENNLSYYNLIKWYIKNKKTTQAGAIEYMLNEFYQIKKEKMIFKHILNLEEKFKKKFNRELLDYLIEQHYNLNKPLWRIARQTGISYQALKRVLKSYGYKQKKYLTK